MENTPKTFNEFWPYYLNEHRNPICRLLHFVGTFLVFILTGVLLSLRLWHLLSSIFPLLLIIGYGPAWIGHFFFEKNKPASFRYPFWSLRADVKMFFNILSHRSLFFLFLLSLFLFNSPSVLALIIGEKAPAFKLLGHNGKIYQLSDDKGHFVVLEWFNQGCPFVKKHYESGHMQELQKHYTDKGVRWYSIVSSAKGKQGYLTQDEARKVKEEKKSMNTAILLDIEGKTGLTYGAKTTPQMFIIDPKGFLVYEGAIDDHPSTDTSDLPKSKNFVEEALKQALSGQKIKIAKTKTYGCAVKY